MEILNELLALLSANLTPLVAILVSGLLVLAGKKAKPGSLIAQGLSLAIKNKNMLMLGIVRGLQYLLGKIQKKQNKVDKDIAELLVLAKKKNDLEEKKDDK